MRRILASIGILMMSLLYVTPITLALPNTAYAADPPPTTEGKLCEGANIGGASCAANPKESDVPFQNRLATITNVILYLIGAVSVIVIIYGGFRYVTSTGDAARVKAAKDTIIYAIAGLVVAIMSYGIVNFVINQFGG